MEWIVSRTAQQGFDFEQIAARKVAEAFADGKLSFGGEEIEKAPDPNLATTLTASKKSLWKTFSLLLRPTYFFSQQIRMAQTLCSG